MKTIFSTPFLMTICLVASLNAKAVERDKYSMAHDTKNQNCMLYFNDDDYESLWKKIEKHIDDGLPLSALKDAEELYKKAVKNEHFAWTIKSGLTMVALRQDISADSVMVDVDKLEKHPLFQNVKASDDAKTKAERALLHSLLSSVYESVSYSRLTRTNVDVKADFKSKRESHALAALNDLESLAGFPSKDYEPLYKKGNESRLYENDVLSLVVNFACNQMGRNTEQNYELCKKASEIYASKGMRNAAVLMKLDALKYQETSRNNEVRLKYNHYLDSLKNIYTTNSDIEAGAEALLRYLRGNSVLPLQERYELADWGEKQWAETNKKAFFSNIKRDCLQPELAIEIKGASYSGRPCTMLIRHRNVAECSIQFMPDNNVKAMSGAPLNDLPALKAIKFDSYTEGKAEEMHVDTLQIDIPAGYWLAVAKSGEIVNKQSIHTTSMKVLSLSLPGKYKVGCVVDAVTGKPISNCEVIGSWYGNEGDGWKNHSKTYRTNEQGLAYMSSETSEFYAQRYKHDVSYTCNTSSLYSFESINTFEYKSAVYTDRHAYRPGQTVHITGLMYKQTGDEVKVVKDFEPTFIIKDANWQEIGKINVKTDEWGVASTDFTLPTGSLNGTFTITFGNTSTNILVEEYKRPNFNIEFEELEKTYALGDSVEIRGRAMTYSGVPVQNAKVSYTVQSREATFWTWWYRNTPWTDLKSDETTTDNDGWFYIRTRLTNQTTAEMLLFRFNASVTDMAGETHEAEEIIKVSEQDFALSIKMPKSLNADASPVEAITVNAVNSSQNPVAVTGEWKLMFYSKITEKYSTEIQSGTFTNEQPIALANIKKLPLGSYQIQVKAVDSRNNDIKANQEFVLWSDKRAEEMNLNSEWIYSPSSTYSQQSPIEVWYANAENNAYTYIYIATPDSVIKRELLISDNKIHHLQIPFNPKYNNGITLYKVYVKDCKTYSSSQRWTYVTPEKQLKLTWKTFRDRLVPGQKETWTLSIRDHNDKIVDASLLATMYDASLDIFGQHSLPLSLYFHRESPYIHHVEQWIKSSYFLSIPFSRDRLSTKTQAFNELYPYSYYQRVNIFYTTRGAGNRPYLGRVLKSAAIVEESEDMVAEVEASVDDSADEVMLADSNDENNEIDSEEIEESGAQKTTIRTNLSETAFFYPTLATNAKGEVDISFTLPESLTEWRFLGLAHTKNMDYGSISAKAVARKQLMIQPNMPRFVRDGDKVCIASRIINQSEGSINGTAIIRLIDAESEEVVFTSSAPFATEAGTTTSVEFNFDATDEYPMLICEIVAESKTHSDGERNYLPVLTNKKQLTETVPFYLIGDSVKQVDVTSLFNNNSATATKRKMTVEYTDNPSWNAVMAMHSTINPESDNAIAWSASLYTNMVAQHLASRTPALQSLIRKWQEEPDSTSTLSSELSKNESLKDIILKESPWVLEAQDETMQKRQLCELFDEKLLNSRIKEAINHLNYLQDSDGGWSWMKGMEPSYYCTLLCVHHLSMLQNYLTSQNIENDDIEDMLEDGIKFLDKEELESYKKYYRKHTKYLPSESTINYLYVKAISKKAHSSSAVKKMTEDYLNRLQKRISELTMYGRAHVSVILLNNNRRNEALKFVRSLREYLVEKPGMGKYFDTELAYYSWRDYRIPTHIAAMQAIQQSGDYFTDSNEYLLQMQLWLLRQKQTQKWDNNINTLQAVDLLLTIAPESTNGEIRTPSVVIGNKPLTLNGQTAGVGYTCTTVPDSLIAGNAPSTVTVSLDGTTSLATPAWGCIYGQCLEDLDRVEKSTGDLSISTKLYVEVQTDNGKEWKEVADGDILHIGDKVRQRLTITSDRDMDFVAIRAQHPACFESKRTISGYQNLGGRGGYLSLHDSMSDVFFDRYVKGSSTIDLEYYVARTGNYSMGIATIQCSYAPQFSAHSQGIRVTVK